MYINAFLEPNTKSKILTSTRYIQGSYNVVQTKEELNILSTTYKNILVDGSPCYVEEEKQLYRWRNNSWVPDDNRTSFQYWNISYTEKDGGDN